MLYRLLKRIFWIKANIQKQVLFNTLGIKNGDEYVKEIINHRRVHINDSPNFVELLSIKAIKIKLNWLFQRYPVNPKWTCRFLIDANHVINNCYKTMEWRMKWNAESEKVCRLKIWNVIMTWKKTDNSKEVATLINNAVDDLVMEYLG